MATWRPIPGFECRYEVSDTGRIRTCRRAVPCVAPNGARTFQIRPARIVRQAINRRGHRRVMLWAGDRKRHLYVHALVALAFLGPRPDGLLVCHRDDRKANNRATNLYYGTRLDNARDARANGRFRPHRRRRKVTP